MFKKDKNKITVISVKKKLPIFKRSKNKTTVICNAKKKSNVQKR